MNNMKNMTLIENIGNGKMFILEFQDYPIWIMLEHDMQKKIAYVTRLSDDDRIIETISLDVKAKKHSNRSDAKRAKKIYDAYHQKLMEERERELETEKPKKLAQILELLKASVVEFEVDCDSNGIIVINFPYPYLHRSRLSVQDDSWEIDYVLETLKEEEKTRIKEENRRKELKAWVEELPQETLDMIVEINNNQRLSYLLR